MSPAVKLQGDSQCTYVGMTNSQEPQCQGKSITCVLDKKYLGELIGENSTVTKTKDEYKEESFQKCDPKIPGGRNVCKNGEVDETKVVMWLKFVKEEQKNWFDSRDHCASIGGSLFSNLNGTMEQLEFLRTNAGGLYWLGVFILGEIEKDSLWETVTGSLIHNDRLVWQINEPKESPSGTTYVAGRNQGLVTRENSTEARFICDML